MTRPDPYLGDCVLHPGCAAVELGIAFGPDQGSVKRDFCAECIAGGEDIDNFGRCYVCRDFQDHEHCIGVPCQCPCPTPDQRRRQQLREEALNRLTPEERWALGVY